jgi:hypothetical protein
MKIPELLLLQSTHQDAARRVLRCELWAVESHSFDLRLSAVTSLLRGYGVRLRERVEITGG